MGTGYFFVAKKERAESWDDMDEVGRSFSNDCVSAFDELLAIKEAEPAAVIDDNHELTIDGSWIGHVPWLQSNMRLIRKPE